MASMLKKFLTKRKMKAEDTAAPSPSTVEKKKVYIVFYSMYGHVYKMAQSQKEGVDSVEGCEGVLYQVRETLEKEILDKMHAAPKPDVPVLNPEDVPQADGVIFGFPTRFGMMAAQMKAFFDATGGLWHKGALRGKPAAIFTSTGTQNGGQETTIFTALTQLAHHGMIFVPLGYGSNPAIFSLDEVHGGSAWGAGCLASADGSRQPSEYELGRAKEQGSYFATTLKAMKGGRKE